MAEILDQARGTQLVVSKRAPPHCMGCMNCMTFGEAGLAEHDYGEASQEELKTNLTLIVLANLVSKAKSSINRDCRDMESLAAKF
ncbi:hypothetical protein BVY04_00620 [bacterium M21]|nr:hypothetical protein BVY04_00620 [bacterium M21]